ncbi:MAG TPA: cupredoxin domain-containing protein [Gaiellaceae bacterium]|nr:cupredoxin domain-containing protein [Gaiellaceae bacterium]
MRRALPLSALLAAALLAGGCGSDDESGGGTTAAGEQTVELTASEYAFDPSDVSLDAGGSVTFRVTNDGDETHALEVEGNGVEEETEEIAPGETGEVTVDLQAGEYEFYCPVDGHKDKGMEGSLVVGGAGAGTGADTGGGTTTEDSGYGG